MFHGGFGCVADSACGAPIGGAVDFAAVLLSAGRVRVRIGRRLLRGTPAPAFGQIDGLIAHANQPCSIQPSAESAGRKAQARWPLAQRTT